MLAQTHGKKRLKTRCQNASRKGGSRGPAERRSNIKAKNMPPTQITAAITCSATSVAVMRQAYTETGASTSTKRLRDKPPAQRLKAQFCHCWKRNAKAANVVRFFTRIFRKMLLR